MAFVVKKNIAKELNKTKSQEFTHESGLKVTLKSFFNPTFQKAYEVIMRKSAAEANKTLTLEAVDDINDDTLTPDEAMVYAVGNYLVEDWDAVDESGEKLEVNGENFQLLVGSMDDPAQFFKWVMKQSQEVTKAIADEIDDTKKKQSKDGAGKKSTQD